MSALKKTVRLLHVFPSFEVGGSQIRLVQLIRRLGSDYQHDILSLNGKWDAMSLLSDLDNVHQLPLPSDWPAGLGRFPAIRKFLREHEPDLLITYNWGAVEFALANRFLSICPHIDIEDGFGPEEVQNRLPRRNLARRLAYSGAKSLVVPSRKLEQIADQEWKISKNLIRYLPNGIDTKKFEDGADPDLLAELGLGRDKDKPIIGTIAGLRREKNIGRLIEAFQILRKEHDAKLLIVGDGPERSNLERQAADTGLAADIIFTGRIEEPSRIVGYFDIFALSSDTEQMPLSVLEAMAAGVPIASVDVGDISSMVSSLNIKYLTEVDARQLALAISQILADPEVVSSLVSENGQRVCEEFEISKMVESYDHLFREYAICRNN